MSGFKMLEGKTVMVTGTARGMGKAMVELFARNGANVIAHARTQTEAHEKMCSDLSKECGVSVVPIYFDLKDQEKIKEAVKTVKKLFPVIDGLVNNAGITNNSLFQMTSMDVVREQFEVNFFSPYLLTQYISKLMVRQGKGSIVNIASSAGQDGNSGKSAYGSSKAALICMTKCISEELAQSGVRANAICPGITETDMVSTMPDYVNEMQKQSACLGKNADVKDIANTAMFLLSDYSSYITGQAIRVDGGVLEYYKR